MAWSGLGSHVDVGTLSVTHFDFGNASHSIEFLLPLKEIRRHLSTEFKSADLQEENDNVGLDVNVTRWAWRPLKEAAAVQEGPGCCLLVYAGESLSYMTSGSVWPLFHRVGLNSLPRISFPWFHRLEGNVDMSGLHLQKPPKVKKRNGAPEQRMLMRDFFQVTNSRVHVVRKWSSLDSVHEW